MQWVGARAFAGSDWHLTWNHFPHYKKPIIRGIPLTKGQLCGACTKWRHNRRDSVSNHQPHDCLLNRLFRRRSKKTSKLRVTGLCAVNSPGTSEFPAQMASYAENVSICWRHHVISSFLLAEEVWTNNRVNDYWRSFNTHLTSFVMHSVDRRTA